MKGNVPEATRQCAKILSDKVDPFLVNAQKE